MRQSYEKAAKWFEKSVEQGHKDAQFNLGSMYIIRQGVEKDHAEATKGIRKAAKQGHKIAQKRLSP